MKKLLFSSVFLALALAVQADEAKSAKNQKAAKDEAPCCSEKNTKIQTSIKTTTTKVAATKEKTACCASDTACKEMPSRKVFLSPKAAEFARK